MPSPKPRHQVVQPDDSSLRRIALTRGMDVLVDACEYDNLILHLWVAGKFNGKWYANRTIRINGKKTSLLMHRHILGLKPGDGILADHENGNTLDCRRLNLRDSSHAGNSQNRGPDGGKSRFKGVSPYPYKPWLWVAQITGNGKKEWLGVFEQEEAAARAFDAAAIRLHGEFAWLNFPEEHDRLTSSHARAVDQPQPLEPTLFSA